jgi:hypothetical protein
MQAQQQDSFCKPILDFLSQNILSEDPVLNAKTITWSRFMTVCNQKFFFISGPKRTIQSSNK